MTAGSVRTGSKGIVRAAGRPGHSTGEGSRPAARPRRAGHGARRQEAGGPGVGGRTDRAGGRIGRSFSRQPGPSLREDQRL